MPDFTRPPCWPEGRPCPNACARAQHERIVHNRHELHGPWHGWRFAGRELVSPDGDRINAERLRGLLFAESLRRRYADPRPADGAVDPRQRIVTARCAHRHLSVQE